MSLPHVLLGLLAESPRTGYELAQTIEEEVEPVWRAELSQIYPALARLRRAGFVVLRVLGPRRGPRRNLYRVTAAGRRELRRWVAEPVSAPRAKDEGLARLAFLDQLPPADRRETLLRHEHALAEEIRRLRAGREPRGYRIQARRGAIEKLESTRRFLRAFAAEETGPPLAKPPSTARPPGLSGKP